MYKNITTILGAFTLAVVSVACGPTDTGISTKVKANLTSDATLKAAKIDVDVKNKVVTLSGTIDTSSGKEHAAAVARGTEGAADVINQIVVSGQDAGPGHGYGREMMEKGMAEGKDHGEEKRQ